MSVIDGPIAHRLDEIAEAVGAQPGDLPARSPRDDATPYVWQSDDKALHLTIAERGQVLSDATTSDVDEFLYQYAEFVTTAVAQRTHPLVDVGARREAWAEQFRLLNLLDVNWATRWRTGIHDLLVAAGNSADLEMLPAG